jgi:hypothetical protein
VDPRLNPADVSQRPRNQKLAYRKGCTARTNTGLQKKRMRKERPLRRVGSVLIATMLILVAHVPTVPAYETRVRPPFGYMLKPSKVPIRVHYVASVAGICGSHSGLRTVGCSKKSATRCDIYIKADPTPLTRIQVLMHEKAHCKGWEHG